MVTPPAVEGESIPHSVQAKAVGTEGEFGGGGGLTIFNLALLLGAMIPDPLEPMAIEREMNLALNSPQSQARLRELQPAIAKAKGFTYYNITYKILYTVVSSPKPQTFPETKSVTGVQVLKIDLGSTHIQKVGDLDPPHRPDSAKPRFGGGYYWNAQRTGTLSMQVFSGEQTARGAARRISVQELRSVPGLTSDTQIRDWVGAHGSEAITEIATDQKTRLLNRLLDGWVGAEDLEAVRKICGSVRTSEESGQIKATIGPRAIELGFYQRAILRSILMRMP